jgi:hypothetical protein
MDIDKALITVGAACGTRRKSCLDVKCHVMGRETIVLLSSQPRRARRQAPGVAPTAAVNTRVKWL